MNNPWQRVAAYNAYLSGRMLRGLMCGDDWIITAKVNRRIHWQVMTGSEADPQAW